MVIAELVWIDLHGLPVIGCSDFKICFMPAVGSQDQALWLGAVKHEFKGGTLGSLPFRVGKLGTAGSVMFIDWPKSLNASNPFCGSGIAPEAGTTGQFI